MGVSVERFAGAAAEWDAFVASRPDGTLAHRHAWRAVVARAYGHPCPYLCARGAAGELRGVLPLVHVRSPLLGGSLVSMPYLSAGGPLGDAEAVAALAERAEEEARDARVGVIDLRGPAPPRAGWRAAEERVTCVLEVGEGPDAVWARFPPKLRSQVRRPEKAGAETRFGPGEVDAFFGVFARTMRDLGAPTHPRAFFRAVRDELGADAWFGCVRLDGAAVAAGCAVRHGRGVELVWAGSLREAAPHAPNMLLYWSFLRRAAEEGLRTFDFGRCTPGSGTHRFKRQWGARDVALVWSRGGAAAARPAVSREAPRWALAQRVWRRLPLGVATWLGPHLRAGIAL